ncbi:hypothetical protein Skr01_75580 [Sphaerisporangium krabiense]|nr:hypothetical protein Skr01_75580 [Sphaerisporangium krabiense]
MMDSGLARPRRSAAGRRNAHPIRDLLSCPLSCFAVSSDPFGPFPRPIAANGGRVRDYLIGPRPARERVPPARPDSRTGPRVDVLLTLAVRRTIACVGWAAAGRVSCARTPA